VTGVYSELKQLMTLYSCTTWYWPTTPKVRVRVSGLSEQRTTIVRHETYKTSTVTIRKKRAPISYIQSHHHKEQTVAIAAATVVGMCLSFNFVNV